MVDWRQFFRADGYRLDFGRIAEVGVGTVASAVFTGVVSVILGLADLPISLLSGLADFLGRFVDVRILAPEVVQAAFASAGDFVRQSGPAGYIVALGIVLVTTYVIAEVVSRVR
ncbi:hypothetical protein IL252_11185 [Halomicrobium sp. IBSBa]|uniref:hypothetical protein n=1 Tax=Halomicrobium sp. IBSBa TaxID=2778916 RepID=UPI001ABF0666|nr:hypothetical protein [Halomicrobium sp. IBSBa]MBO4248377.1 hypothetical protein [Halomicrobium sp. IBSBa]